MEEGVRGRKREGEAENGHRQGVVVRMRVKGENKNDKKKQACHWSNVLFKSIAQVFWYFRKPTTVVRGEQTWCRLAAKNTRFCRVYMREEKSLNMFLPQGQTAVCDLRKGKFWTSRDWEGGGEGRGERNEGLSEHVRRRKHNRNINRKGPRSASCYIWRWLSVLGLGAQREIDCFTLLLSLVGRQRWARDLVFFMWNVTVRINWHLYWESMKA